MRILPGWWRKVIIGECCLVEGGELGLNELSSERRRVRIQWVAWWMEESDIRSMFLCGWRRVRIEELSGGWRRVIIRLCCLVEGGEWELEEFPGGRRRVRIERFAWWMRKVIIGECCLEEGGEWEFNELPGGWKRVIIWEFWLVDGGKW